MPDIARSVGFGGQNNKADVVIIQKLLNNYVNALGLSALSADGNIGPATIFAIRKFQSTYLGAADPNGRADPGGRTITALNAVTKTRDPSFLSGAAYWHTNQGRYSNSESLNDLTPEFRVNVQRFLDALRLGGATVTISSTRRNKVRAYLMHYCWRISSGDIAPANVPTEPGCAIIWDHGNLKKSIAAAQEMRDLFVLVYQPALRSRHIEGKAVDMAVRWPGTIKVKDANGVVVSLSKPSNGANPGLHKVGRSYGVIKLLSDLPHWSTDGR